MPAPDTHLYSNIHGDTCNSTEFAAHQAAGREEEWCYLSNSPNGAVSFAWMVVNTPINQDNHPSQLKLHLVSKLAAHRILLKHDPRLAPTTEAP